MNTKPKILYHGSSEEITDGVIHAKPAHTNHMKTKVTAVFATHSAVHAKLYAIMRFVGDVKMMPYTCDTLYVQTLNKNIRKYAYIYELDSDGFERDTDGNYYSLTDTPIKKTFKVDILQELRTGKLKVYVLKNEIDFSNMSDEQAWNSFRQLVEQQVSGQKNNFELYNPDTKNADMSILTQTMKARELD